MGCICIVSALHSSFSGVLLPHPLTLSHVHKRISLSASSDAVALRLFQRGHIRGRKSHGLLQCFSVTFHAFELLAPSDLSFVKCACEKAFRFEVHCCQRLVLLLTIRPSLTLSLAPSPRRSPSGVSRSALASPTAAVVLLAPPLLQLHSPSHGLPWYCPGPPLVFVWVFAVSRIARSHCQHRMHLRGSSDVVALR